MPIQWPLNMTVPYFPTTPPEPSITYNITINQVINSTCHKLFAMNESPFQANYNNPILLLANEKNYSYPYDSQWNVINLGTNSSVRINVWNNNYTPHVSHKNPGSCTWRILVLIPVQPMHLHGHDMWVLHDGPRAVGRKDHQSRKPST